jgi:hypothetical protein
MIDSKQSLTIINNFILESNKYLQLNSIFLTKWNTLYVLLTINKLDETNLKEIMNFQQLDIMT